MSSDEIVINVTNLSKRYEIYATPRDRLKQLVLPAMHNVFSRLGMRPRARIDRQLPQYFREFWALHDVSFQVRRGETVGIVGLNGSGKSTLLQLICSTLTPTSGNVEVKGRVAALLELGSGFNPDYTGRENVFLNGQILGLSREEIQDRFQAIEVFADIGDFIDQPVKTYSSGMVVRLAFAVAINVEPEILVVDEALAVGDVGFQARCFAKIGELKQKGVTLLFVSHSPSAVAQLCDRALLLDKGELLILGTPNQAIRSYNYLASSGPSNYASVRREIVSLTAVENSSLEEAVDDPICFETSGVSIKEEQEQEIGAYLDLKLQETIKPLSFEQRGAEISDISVIDGSGKPVNVLPMHQNFSLRFRVTFEQDFDMVRFSWNVRTLSGLVLGGGSTHKPGFGMAIKGSRQMAIKSNFVNLFTPGDYIVDIGVRGGDESDNGFLHGVTNALSIRSILTGSDYNYSGLVGCLLSPAFELTDGRDQAEYLRYTDGVPVQDGRIGRSYES